MNLIVIIIMHQVLVLLTVFIQGRPPWHIRLSAVRFIEEAALKANFETIEFAFSLRLAMELLSRLAFLYMTPAGGSIFCPTPACL